MSEKRDLVGELKALTKNWNATDLVPVAQQHQCREIGEQLHKLGGMPSMCDAYYAAKAENPCASIIQAYWDGVGEWKW